MSSTSGAHSLTHGNSLATASLCDNTVSHLVWHVGAGTFGGQCSQSNG